MKLNLSPAQIEALMLESATFRQMVISMVSDNSIEFFRREIRRLFPYFMSSEKIPAIKWLRTETQNKTELLKLFNDAGYECYTNESTLGLAAAKKFVESC